MLRTVSRPGVWWALTDSGRVVPIREEDIMREKRKRK